MKTPWGLASPPEARVVFGRSLNFEMERRGFRNARSQDEMGQIERPGKKIKTNKQ